MSFAHTDTLSCSLLSLSNTDGKCKCCRNNGIQCNEVMCGCLLQESLDYEEIMRAVEGICLEQLDNIFLFNFF